MSEMMRENLDRQHKAMVVLYELLQEEFSLLRAGKPQEVTGLEMSIQELIRQIALERAELKSMVLAREGTVVRLNVLVDSMPPEEGEPLRKLVNTIDALEQACARQADKNSNLAMALFDQSKSMLEFMQSQIKPKRVDVYARNGRFAQGKSEAALLHGRY
ncbi:FlgN family protein [Desulfovibrio sp. X2]|uniref:flagellar protein FlgN n=1 Tax=Desulfovibrio sp. X2 TaxID=941449 RepID=UPI0003588F0C|nr:flagellar protein FlgN [Desulfovibrio sp. X2]EPR41706.1 FlgN family protein [Desulfovibrio sp. X2]